MMSVAKYFTLHSSLLDLGSFLFNFHNVAAKDWPRIFSVHAQPLMAAWALQYQLLPSALVPYTTLVSQAAILVIPVIWFFRHYGWLVAIAYALYVPVWVNAHFDFHFDHLAVPLLLAFYLAVKAGKPYLSMIPVLLLMGVKEPFALQAAACGVFLILVGLRRSHGMSAGDQLVLTPNKCRAFTVSGLMVLVVGTAYFYVATQYMIPYFTGGMRGGLDSVAFSWLGQSLGEVISAVLTHPLEILHDILGTPGKLTYLFVVFGLLAFIPLLAPIYLIPALPLVAIAMLSRLPNYYDYNTHYTAGLIIPVMFAFIHGLLRARALWVGSAKWVSYRVPAIMTTLLLWSPTPPHKNSFPQRETAGGAELILKERLSKLFFALLVMWILAGHILLSPSPISRLFWLDKVWSYSWRAYVPTDREAMMKEAMLKYIPANPAVSVASQNTVNWEHLAHRRIYVAFPDGVIEPMKVVTRPSQTLGGFWRFVRSGEIPLALNHGRYADYVVLDLKRPWFIVDKGCEWIYGECRDKAIAREFLDLVAKTKARYVVLFEHDGFLILGRR